MSQEKLDPPPIAVSAGPPCWAAALLFGREHICEVPRTVAICPECGGDLFVEAEWDESTDKPTRTGLSVSCCVEDSSLVRWENSKHDNREFRDVAHRHWQSDWQPIVDRIAEACGAVTD